MRVVGIAGSLRKDSYNKKLLAYAATVAAKHDVRLEIVEFGALPVLNQDDEKPNPPEAVVEFRSRLAQADAFVFCTPEYNNTIPGGLKNAIDWGSRPPQNVFDGKLAVVMGATPGGFGTVQASRDLRNLLMILNTIVIPTPFVYVSKVQDAFDEAGNLKDEKLAANVEALLKRLFEVTRAVRGVA